MTSGCCLIHHLTALDETTNVLKRSLNVCSLLIFMNLIKFVLRHERALCRTNRSNQRAKRNKTV